MNLLFTNAGRRTYLIDFALELQNNGYPVRLFVSDSIEYTASFWVSKKVTYFLTPRVDNNEGRYLDALLDECKRNKIDVIIPLMDYELPVLARNKKFFKDEGIETIISDFDVVDKCLDKQKNYYFCLEKKIPVPTSYFSLSENTAKFPLIKKKILGSGSAGFCKIEDRKGLYNFVRKEDMLQDYICGTEYGMNILNDLDGEFLHATFCKKILMRAGETDKAIGVSSERFIKLARTISVAYRHIGNMDVDFIVDKKGDIYCLDFNPRFGGLYPIAHLAGFNYLKYVLDMSQGKKIRIPTKRRNIAFMKGISLHSFEI